MPWRTIATGDIQARFIPTELSQLNTLAGASTGLQTALTDVIRAFVSAMRGAEYPVNSDDTVPDGLRIYVIALTVVTWLRMFPNLSDEIMTKERVNAAKRAEEVFDKIVNLTFGKIESPTGTDLTTQNWNSLPKIIGRMNPVPLPAVQLSATPTPLYVNPNAPTDTVPTSSPGVPTTPLNFTATAQNGKVLLEWDPVAVAVTYVLYRGLTPGTEVSYVTGITGTNYSDGAVVNETFYYYKLVSVNSVGTSSFTNEVVAKPTAMGTP